MSILPESQLCDGYDEFAWATYHRSQPRGPRLWVVVLWALAVLAFCALPLLASDSARARVRQSMCLIDNGCSGVVVSRAGHVMSAKHCDPPGRVVVMLADGTRVSASRLYVDTDIDGPVVLQLEGATIADDAYCPVATHKPSVGEAVLAAGFEGGDDRNPTVLAAQVTGMATVAMDRSISPYRGNVIDVQSMHGMSGGPVVNGRGELVGLISSGDPQMTVIMRHSQLLSAVRATVYRESPSDQRPQLVAFVSTSCAPCEAFKRDLAAGHFAAYDVQVVTFDQRSGTWSDGGVAWKDATKALKKLDAVAFPAFWLRGTDEARVGYRQRQGLIQWVGSVIIDVGRLVFGDSQPQPVVPEIEAAPAPLTSDSPAPEPYDRDAVAQLRAQVATLRDVVGRLRDDAAKFQDAGVIGKIRLIDDLKRDVAAAKDAAGKTKTTIQTIRHDPLHHLWGSVTGLLLGLIKRKVMP